MNRNREIRLAEKAGLRLTGESWAAQYKRHCAEADSPMPFERFKCRMLILDALLEIQSPTRSFVRPHGLDEHLDPKGVWKRLDAKITGLRTELGVRV